MAQQPDQSDGQIKQRDIQRTNRKRYSKAPRSRHRDAINDHTSENSWYSSSDPSDSSDSSGGVSLVPSLSETGWNTSQITSPKSDGNNAASVFQQSRPLSLICGICSSSAENQRHSTSSQIPEAPGIVLPSRPVSRDNTPPFEPLNLGGVISHGAPQPNSGSLDWTAVSDAAPGLNGLNEGAVREYDHQHTRRIILPKRPAIQPTSRQAYFAYVEDADSDESAAHDANSSSSLAVETGVREDRRQRMVLGPSLSESGVLPDGGLSKSSFRVISPTSSDSDYSSTASGSWDGENSPEDDQNLMEPSLSPTPSSSSKQPSLSGDTHDSRSRARHRKTFPRRTLRPRRQTESSTSRNHRNPFSPNYSNYPYQNAKDYAGYRPPPPSYDPYGPRLGLNVPPYAPSAPGPSFGSPLSPYETYSQYPDFNLPSGYPNYNQHAQGNTHNLTTNPNYFQPPPHPLSTYNLEPVIESHALGPTPQIVGSDENVLHTAPIPKTATPYKPPVSSGPSGHDISCQIPFKSSSTSDSEVKGKSVASGLKYSTEMSGHWEKGGLRFGQGGKSCLTRIRSLEHCIDRSGQDRITVIRPHSAETNKADGARTLRWLHIQQNALCLNDLRELVRNCRFLEDDLISVADRFLEMECAKFEKKYSSGNRQGYYIEPGTVLRCDVRYDQDLNRGTKSVFFCSVPYLQLDSHGKLGKHGDLGEDGRRRTHPARTLMESLYDYGLLDDRDSRQAILQCQTPGNDNILYIPQIWYLLCGSDILISYSQLPLDEISRDSIQARDESDRSLIAVVTDLDNHQFSVSLKSTDSFFVSLRLSIIF
ncbi:hypothetical protein F5X98DRAFT_90315 [Xylaria grammica]|nr:hypothetical protein F5X98DRAFT_90315 [Xylaria grammica]